MIGVTLGPTWHPISPNTLPTFASKSVSKFYSSESRAHEPHGVETRHLLLQIDQKVYK